MNDVPKQLPVDEKEAPPETARDAAEPVSTGLSGAERPHTAYLDSLHLPHKWPLTVKLLAALLMVNTFAIGLWIGAQFLSREKDEATRKAAVSQMEIDLPDPPPSGSPRPSTRLLGDTTIADIAQKVAPAVVTIEVMPKKPGSKEIAVTGEIPQPQYFFGPRMTPEQPPSPFPFQNERRTAGSGVVIRADGYILTNSHVARQDSVLKVTLSDKREYMGKLVGRDSFTDLALVRIDEDDLPTVKMGSSKNLRPGDWAVAIGNPFGFNQTVTLGIVSAIGRSLADLNHHVDLIQTDAAINPGNSGGPLLNLEGEVIGINTAIRYDAQNIGFAIPVDVAKEVAQGLLANNTIARPYLGIYMRDLDPRARQLLGLKKDVKGVLVRKVVPGGPSHKAKIAPGDLIQKVDNVSVSSSREMREVIKRHKPGDTLHLVVSRHGVNSNARLVVGDYSKEVLDE